MAIYKAPIDDMMFLFEKLRDNSHYNSLEKYKEVSPDLAKHTHMRSTALCRHWRQCGQRCANLATAYKLDQAIRARKPPIYMTQGLLKQWLFKSKSPQSTAEGNGDRTDVEDWEPLC